MTTAIRILAYLVLGTYLAYTAAFALSIWSLSSPGPAPADKSVGATPITVVISSAILWLIPIFALAVGVLSAVSSNQRMQKGWRNAFTILAVLAFPGPVLGAALVVGGLFAGGVLFVIIPGILLVFAPIVMSIAALVHERRSMAPTPTVFAPAI